MKARLAIFFLVGAALVAACSVSLDDPAGRACDTAHGCAGARVCVAGRCVLPGADAGGGTSADAGDAASGPNLHGDGTFESGCGKWQVPDGTQTPSTTAHGGSGSCRACASTAAGFALDDKGFLTNPPLGTYRATAWVRIAPGDPATSYGILLRTVNEPSGRFDEIEKNATNAEFVDGWSPISVELPVTKPADILNVVVYTHGPTCMLVDDVTVERLP